MLHKRKVVLITGATGFLGSNLVRKLLLSNFQVVIIKRSTSDISRIIGVMDQLLVFNAGDIDNIFKVLGHIDIVIHTAGCYGRAGESLEHIIETNVHFPKNVFKMAKKNGTNVFINTDTTLPSNLNNYSQSKSSFRKWGEAFSKDNSVQFVNLRLEHMYGPGDSNEKFSSYVINNLLKNVREIDLTLGMQQRDFIYIDDVVDAYMLVLNNLNKMKPTFNSLDIGTGHPISIRKFVSIAKKATGSTSILRFGALPYRNNEVMLSNANIKELTRLGWKRRYSLEEGILKTVQSEKLSNVEKL